MCKLLFEYNFTILASVRYSLRGFLLKLHKCLVIHYFVEATVYLYVPSIKKNKQIIKKGEHPFIILNC